MRAFAQRIVAVTFTLSAAAKPAAFGLLRCIHGIIVAGCHYGWALFGRRFELSSIRAAATDQRRKASIGRHFANLIEMLKVPRIGLRIHAAKRTGLWRSIVSGGKVLRPEMTSI